MSDEIKVQAKNKKTKIIITVSAVVIAVLTIIAIVLINSNSAIAKKVKEQLSLGEKYLSELNYEQAIAAYELAIEIDPKSADAYLGLAAVYEEMGEYDKAIEVLEEAKSVVDEEELKRVEAKLKEIEEKKQEASKPVATATPVPTATPEPTPTWSIRKPNVGDLVRFGTYEQDNNLANGAEGIEWLVLDVQDGKLLLLSQYGLDAQRYNETKEDVTWENCTLRSWLNEEFYKVAFTEKERSYIAETLVVNADNLEYETEAGNDTRDKVFLLSIEEVLTYVDSDLSWADSDRRVHLTKYANTLGEWYSESEGAYVNCWWWLRSPGYYDGLNEAFLGEGGYSYGGYSDDSVVDYVNVVRPALWLTY